MDPISRPSRGVELEPVTVWAAKDKKGRVTVKSLYNYLLPQVQDGARRQNRDQTPTLRTTSDLVIRSK